MSSHAEQHADCAGRSDEDLVGLVLQDQERYLCLMRRYESRLLRYVMGLTGLDRDESEDILQEAFISAYRNLRGFDLKRKFSSWIYRIAHNAAVSDLRKRRTRAKYVLPELSEGVLESLASDLDIGAEQDRRLEAETIQAAIARLKEGHRDILVLHFLEGMDYNEISEVLRLPLGTVGSRLSRAKAAFGKTYRGQAD